MLRFVRPWSVAVPVRSFYYAAPKKEKGGGKGGKDKGGATAAAPVGGPGDFPPNEMYEELKLGEMKDSDVPTWAKDIAKEALKTSQDSAERLPGREDRRSFKLQRREKIKEDNERRGMGL